MKRVSWLVGGIVLGFMTVGLVSWRIFQSDGHEETHYHAGFQIYVDGILQDYSSDQYMKIEECRVEETDFADPIERVHLHNNVGDVAHVHQAGVVWGDLFHNLNISIDQAATQSAFVNGEAVLDVMTRPINANDSLVMLIGNFDNPQKYLNQQVTVEHIAEVEKLVESCGL